VDRVDQGYFDEVTRPLLANPRVDFIGEIAQHEKQNFLGREPYFSQSTGRALWSRLDRGHGLWHTSHRMASGVRAGDRGHGITGFVVDSIEEALRAVERLGSLNRAAVRRRFEARFTAKGMARDYSRIYESVAAMEPLTLHAA
jgi:hypothetical protein